jgi:hypothetical protein
MSETAPALPFTVCYVLTGGAGSVYADMTAVSVLSLLAIHPGTAVTVLGDEATVRELVAADGPLARNARLQPVPVPESDTVGASRSIKTRMREVIEGDLLFLDADTIPVRPVDAALATSRDVRIAHDRHLRGGGPALEISAWVDDLLVRAGWPRPLAYFNSGVMWLPDTAPAHRLCAEWRRLWLEGCRHGVWKDQPALNVALHALPGPIEPLPPAYNVHPYSAPQHIRRARILHFWATTGIELERPMTLLEHLVADFRRSGGLDRAAIDRARRRNYPWVRPRGIRSALEAHAWGEAAAAAVRRLVRQAGIRRVLTVRG